jgi:hypothetical protein
MNSQETLSVISYFLQDDWESESAFYETIPIITRLKNVIYGQDWVFEESDTARNTDAAQRQRNFPWNEDPLSPSARNPSFTR